VTEYKFGQKHPRTTGLTSGGLKLQCIRNCHIFSFSPAFSAPPVSRCLSSLVINVPFMSVFHHFSQSISLWVVLALFTFYHPNISVFSIPVGNHLAFCRYVKTAITSSYPSPPETTAIKIIIIIIIIIGHLFRYVTNQTSKSNSAFHPSGVGR